MPRRRRRRYSRSHAAPRRRRRRRYAAPATRHRRRTYRRRRRNAGIAPFVQANPSGPLILSNPRRRRRRRNPKLNLKSVLSDTLVYLGGGVLGYGVNQFGLSQISHDWARRGSQVLLAVGGAMFLKGGLGASFAGATMYPLIADLAMLAGLVATPTTEQVAQLTADLEAALEADLQGSDELYIDDFEPMQNQNLVAW